MTGERAEPPMVDDEPLGTADPTWRDERPATEPPGRPDDDAERTIDADPAWLAELTGDAAPELAGAGDAERTIDVDADLLEHVRAAARAARDGLAAPPPAPEDEPEAIDTEPSPAAARMPGVVDPWRPPPPGGATSTLLPPAEPGALPPPSVPPPDADAPAPPAQTAPVAAAGTVGAASPATTRAVTPAGGGRWQPPARLRPAEVRPTAPLLADRSPTRRHLDWRWAALGIVLAAAVGFLIAFAVRGGDDTPDPAPGSTTVPGASTTVSTP